MKKSKNSEYILHESFDDEIFKDAIKQGIIYTTKVKENSGYPCYRDTESERLAIVLPQTPCWCNSCKGDEGKMRSKFDIEGLDIDKMLENDDDGELREDYFSGKTDVFVPCEECKGTGISFQVDEDNLTELQKNVLEQESKDMDSWFDSKYESDAISATERRMGA